MTEGRRVLWVDDDGDERFPYEISCLAKIGWSTSWAQSAEEAFASLVNNAYDLVLLDQVFPVRKGQAYKDVWSGCRLLYWLRGVEVPAEAPPRDDWRELIASARPSVENASLPVIIISAFQDDLVDEAVGAVSPPTLILPKPVDENILLRHVKALKPQRR